MSEEQTETQEESMTLVEWLNDVLGMDGEWDTISCNGFDDCIIGLTEGFGGQQRLVYDKQLMLAKMMERDGMSEEDAQEFFDFNIIGAYTNPNDPIYLVATAPKLRESIQEEE